MEQRMQKIASFAPLNMGTTAPQPEKISPYEVLKIKDFRRFLSLRMCLTLATQIEAMVVGWQIYQITHDPLSLGLIGLAEAIPAIAVSLYAGHLADMVNRRKIIVICQAILVVSSLLLFGLTLNAFKGLLSTTILPIYALIFVTGLARGFIGPAIFSFMPQLVDKKLFSNAVTWSSTNWQLGAIIGPALGGVLLSLIGLTYTYLVQSVLMCLSLVFALLIASRPLPESTEKPAMKERLVAGIKFVFGNQPILSAISLDLFAVLFGGAVALLPAFQKDILHVDELGLGIMRSAPAVGSVLMAIVLAYKPMNYHAGRKMLFCVAGFGLCMIGFGLSRSFWLSVALLFMSGVFDFVSVIIRSTMLQVLTPENMKGRVSAVNNIFVGSSNEIGAFESGFTARLMGTAASVVFGGTMTLVVVAVTAWKAKSLRNLHI